VWFGVVSCCTAGEGLGLANSVGTLRTGLCSLESSLGMSRNEVTDKIVFFLVNVSIMARFWCVSSPSVTQIAQKTIEFVHVNLFFFISLKMNTR